jgi:hypothetical protein
MKMSVQLHKTSALSSGKEKPLTIEQAVNYRTEGWVDPRAYLHAVQKRETSCRCCESKINSSVMQPVAWQLH